MRQEFKNLHPLSDAASSPIQKWTPEMSTDRTGSTVSRLKTILAGSGLDQTEEIFVVLMCQLITTF